ncbi:unnamed protein product [Triticum turgidum subsp. durum]|uniref:F-box associated beta-propeller type 3 domain-containing protein n=1 Tax=Triticum turgidum subsp. durum TaxID=4567 RepID=A0A9R1NJJ3_TRITD|nr:unnamed protein product [Triticum turgidum subsp. durum]
MTYRAGLVPADQSQFVARLGSVDLPWLASCDGLLVIFVRGEHFFVRNPATRQSANLPLLHGFRPLGMYRHSPTGEYRLLLYRSRRWMYGPLPPDVQEGSYVFAIGSGQPPRHIGWHDAEKLICTAGPVMFGGRLHWYTCHVIMIFDNTTESFRQMRSPFVPGHAQLFEMDNMLGMSVLNDEGKSVDIWVVQDYEGGDWALKYRVELPAVEIRVQFGMSEIKYWHVRVVSCDGDVLVLLKFDDWLLQVDINGELVAGFHHRDLILTQVRLKQSLVLHTFFPTLEG